MEFAILMTGSVLTLAPIAVAAVLARPSPPSWREIVYLTAPLVGAVALVLAAWARF